MKYSMNERIVTTTENTGNLVTTVLHVINLMKRKEY